MAKERFLIVAVPMPDDCFGRFSETENRAAIDAGTMDPDDPYAWVEASFELVLVRHREATHLCSFTPSAYYVWIQNAFVGEPNAAWEYDGDPDGLERESGGEGHGYCTYRDEYDPRFVCETFTIDTVRDLGMRKPRDSQEETAEVYHRALWKYAEEAAHEIACNGLDAPILSVWTYRQWERERREAVRRASCEQSKRNGGLILA